MLDYKRQRLASMQAELVRALTEGAEAPADFDGERLAAAAETLLLKRRRTVARAWPQLARALGSEFAGRFADYAQSHPLPLDANPLVDGRAFASWLGGKGWLAEEGRIEAFAFDARYRIRNGVLRGRRGAWMRALRLRQSHRLIIILRLPLWGERWIEVRDSLKPRRRARV